MCDAGIERNPLKLRRAAGRKAHLDRKSSDYEHRRKGMPGPNDDDDPRVKASTRLRAAPSYQEVLEQEMMNMEAEETTATEGEGLDGFEYDADTTPEGSPFTPKEESFTVDELLLPPPAVELEPVPERIGLNCPDKSSGHKQKGAKRIDEDAQLERKKARGRLQRKADRAAADALELQKREEVQEETESAKAPKARLHDKSRGEELKGAHVHEAEEKSRLLLEEGLQEVAKAEREMKARLEAERSEVVAMRAQAETEMKARAEVEVQAALSEAFTEATKAKNTAIQEAEIEVLALRARADAELKAQQEAHSSARAEAEAAASRQKQIEAQKQTALALKQAKTMEQQRSKMFRKRAEEESRHKQMQEREMRNVQAKAAEERAKALQEVAEVKARACAEQTKLLEEARVKAKASATAVLEAAESEALKIRAKAEEDARALRAEALKQAQEEAATARVAAEEAAALAAAEQDSLLTVGWEVTGQAAGAEDEEDEFGEETASWVVLP